MISPDDYLFLQGYLRERMGYDLNHGREDLVANRLGPIAASFGLEDVAELVGQVRAGEKAAREAVVEAMTTAETYFFRGKSFESLRTVILPALITARAFTRRLRLWCGACSTGQEVYSIAMTLADHFPQLHDWYIELLATDISEQALSRARDGTYSQFEVQRGLPVQSLLKHFVQQGDRWRISDNLRRRVRFVRYNLIDDFASLGGPFDVVFVRNVLIYFDAAAKTSMFAKLRQVVAHDGYLILGESETILGLTDQFAIPELGCDYYRPA